MQFNHRWTRMDTDKPAGRTCLFSCSADSPNGELLRRQKGRAAGLKVRATNSKSLLSLQKFLVGSQKRLNLQLSACNLQPFKGARPIHLGNCASRRYPGIPGKPRHGSTRPHRNPR
jgi:hypothetical protein